MLATPVVIGSLVDSRAGRFSERQRRKAPVAVRGGSARIGYPASTRGRALTVFAQPRGRRDARFSRSAPEEDGMSWLRTPAWS